MSTEIFPSGTPSLPNFENKPAEEEKEAFKAPDRQTLRKFSKEHSPEERKKLAAELWLNRKEYFDKSSRREAIIKAFTEQAISREITAQEATRRIQEIEELLRERRGSLAKAVIYYFDSRRLESEKADLEALAVDVVRGIARLTELRQEVESQYVDRDALKKSREELSEFYAGQEKIWTEYQEGEKSRDVKTVMRKNNAYFVHGIKDRIVPNENSLLRHGTTLEAKLNILLAFEPTLSTSTIQKGDSIHNMWARAGVLLSGGRVLNAFNSDAGTVARSFKDRATHEGEEAPASRIWTDIDRAVNRTGYTRQRYNELTVENPEVSALYLCLDDAPGVVEYNSITVERMLEISKSTGLPLYAMSEGVVYEMVYEEIKPQWKEVKLKRVVSPEEIAGKAKATSPEQRAALSESILENSPFRLLGPEAGFVKQRSWAQRMYVELWADRLASVTPQRTEAYTGDDFSDTSWVDTYGRLQKGQIILQKGEQVELLDEIHSPDGELLKIIRHNGELFTMLKRAPKNMDQIYIAEFPETERLMSREKRPWISDGPYHLSLSAGGFNLGRPARTETFIDDVFAQVAYCKAKIAELQKELDENSYVGAIIKNYEQSISDIAYYLYGLGEEAEKFSDTATRDKAWQLAGQIIPLENIREVIKRRINDKGGFRITKEDIG